MSRPIPLLLAMLVLAARVASAAPPEPLPALIARTTPGVCTILSYNPDLVMPGIGTGFFVAPDRVITVRHVFARADRAVIRTRDGSSVGIAGILAEQRDVHLVLVQLTKPG